MHILCLFSKLYLFFLTQIPKNSLEAGTPAFSLFFYEAR